MKSLSLSAAGALLLSSTCLYASAEAASLNLQIIDAAGWPSSEAVAFLEPASGQTLPKHQHSAQIEQRGRRFAPLVTVVQTGTAISFPNRDSVRHQVYSFSAPKIFELKLYSGAGGDPIIFDKPGTVIIGCNIHDQMAAFIQVVDTPYFAKSDASGKLSIDNILPGKYQLKIWHSSIPASIPMPVQPVTIANTDLALPILLTFKTEKK